MNEASMKERSTITLTELLEGLYELEPLGLPADALRSSVGELRSDSRAVTAGDTFVALPSAVAGVDGRNFVAAAIAQGCSLVLRHADELAVSEVDGVLVLDCPLLGNHLSQLAARFYGVSGQAGAGAATVHIGITGTNGKTTCAQWLARLLDSMGGQSASIGTLGYGAPGREVSTGMTTPDAISFQRILAELSANGIDHVVSEVSSHSLIQQRVAAVPFSVAVFTNIGRDHLDYHGTMKEYVEAKSRLMAFASLNTAVINIDDVYASKFIYALNDSVRPLSYSLGNADADFYCASFSADRQGLLFTLCSPEGEYPVRTSLWGEFNIYNLLAVVATAYALGHKVSELVEQLSQLPSVDGRMQKVHGGVASDEDLAVLVDFAHTPDALTAALSSLKQHVDGQLWCVFGCGGDRDSGKRPLMAAAVEAAADSIVLTSDNPRGEDPQAIADQVLAGFKQPENVVVELDRGRAIERVIQLACVGDCVLIAGKGHEQFQIIGATQQPFSDLKVAQSALAERSASRGTPS